MSVTALQDTRIDSKIAAVLLVAVFSFALGVMISLMVAAEPAANASAPAPCPTHCPRLILMSTHGPAAQVNSCAPFEEPAAFQPASANIVV